MRSMNPFRNLTTHQLMLLQVSLRISLTGIEHPMKRMEVTVLADQLSKELDARAQDEREAEQYRRDLQAAMDQMNGRSGITVTEQPFIRA